MKYQKAFVVASVMFAGFMFFIFAFISLMLAKSIGIIPVRFAWIGVSFGIFFLMLILHIYFVKKDYIPPTLFEEDIEDVWAGRENEKEAPSALLFVLGR